MKNVFIINRTKRGILEKVTSGLLMLSLNFTLGGAAMLVPLYATYAAAAPSSVTLDTVNGVPPTGHCIAGPITLTGHGSTGGSGGPYTLEVGWGDGATTTASTSPDIKGSGISFTFTASHTPTGPSTGITLFLHHSTGSGNDSFAVSANQCVAPPTTAVLTVQKHVVNDNGGTATAANFTLHVKSGATDVASSPFTGSETGYDLILAPGTYAVSEDAHSGYTQTGITGACAVDGTITAAAGNNYTCTITNDDNVPVNHAPVASDQSLSTNEDTSLPVTLSATDIDGNTLAYSIVSGPSHGTLGTLSGNAVTYTPDANYNGSDSFTWKANDGSLDSNTATVSITVNPVNDPPVLSNVPASATINELVSYTFTATASDVDGDTLTFSLSGAPAGATIDSSTGAFSWTPTEAQGPGVYPFSVVVSDGNGGSNTESITITVNEVNQAPVASGASVSTHVNTALPVTLVATDGDIPANTLTDSIVSGPTNGTLGSISGNSVTYTPNTNYTGSDSFTWKANDGSLDSNTATINITVGNDAPTLAAISDQTVDELTTLSLTAVGTDPNSDPLTFSLSGAPAGATIDSSTGAFSWTPTEAQGPGVYPVTVSVTDGVSTDSKSFNVTVNEVNVAPVAQALAVSTDEDTAKDITLAGTDSDIPVQTLSFTITTPPAHGTLGTIVGDQVTYTPDANYNGPDSFAYAANDGVVSGLPATVDITVNPVNDPPTVTLNGSATMTLTVGDTFTDPGAVGNDVEDGPLTPVVTGSVDTSTAGTYTLTYTVTDSNDASASVDRTVTVGTVPPPPPPPGGGGPGGSGSPYTYGCIDSTAANFNPSANRDDGTCQYAPTTSGGGGGVPAPQGEVLGAATTSDELPLPAGCSAYLNEYLKYGKKNDANEVTKLQTFLNEEMNANLPATGFFGQMTKDWVKKFQVKYQDNILKPWKDAGFKGMDLDTGTGFVFKTTKRWINIMKCESLKGEPMPTLVPYVEGAAN